MKVGIFSPYLETMGGGERYLLTVAEFFLHRGDNVTIFSNHEKNAAEVKTRFDLDLTGVKFSPDVFFSDKHILSKLAVTLSYDLIFFLSDGSIPSTLAATNLLHFQTPFHYANQKTILNKIKLARFKAVVCNSKFTKSYIDKTYDLDSLVLYPPVDVAKFSPGKKENIILSVGHFYGDIRPKRQDIMVKTFIKLGLSKWRLVLIGGARNGAEKEITRLRKIAAGYPIELITDSPFIVTQNHYAKAKIYWHAAGFGTDIEKFPEKAEHFGMSTVEAMAAGAIPIVFAGGGQKEIITNGQNGFFWTTTPELKNITLRVANSDTLRAKIAQAAIRRSKDFSKEKFFAKLNEIL
ncbi:glycosyltransferase [Candidatus Microgenomates bacterium]|nr:glycosyltransferase [Candidatus Microgenomates bacterium]